MRRWTSSGGAADWAEVSVRLRPVPGALDTAKEEALVSHVTTLAADWGQHRGRQPRGRPTQPVWLQTAWTIRGSTVAQARPVLPGCVDRQWELAIQPS